LGWTRYRRLSRSSLGKEIHVHIPLILSCPSACIMARYCGIPMDATGLWTENSNRGYKEKALLKCYSGFFRRRKKSLT